MASKVSLWASTTLVIVRLSSLAKALGLSIKGYNFDCRFVSVCLAINFSFFIFSVFCYKVKGLGLVASYTQAGADHLTPLSPVTCKTTVQIYSVCLLFGQSQAALIYCLYIPVCANVHCALYTINTNQHEK